MITLSGQQTLADLPKFQTGAFTQPGGTQAAPRPVQTGPTGTRAASEEATVMERGVTPGTLSGAAPTMVERKATLGNDEATVMERFGATQSGQGAVPTAAERKWGGDAAAEPTVLERQMMPAAAPPKKKNTALFAAIAAVVAIGLAIGGWFALHRPATPPLTNTVAQSGTQVTTTGTTSTPIPGDRGVLLLTASPWGDIEKIVSANDQK